MPTPLDLPTLPRPLPPTARWRPDPPTSRRWAPPRRVPRPAPSGRPSSRDRCRSPRWPEPRSVAAGGAGRPASSAATDAQTARRTPGPTPGCREDRRTRRHRCGRRLRIGQGIRVPAFRDKSGSSPDSAQTARRNPYSSSARPVAGRDRSLLPAAHGENGGNARDRSRSRQTRMPPIEPSLTTTDHPTPHTPTRLPSAARSAEPRARFEEYRNTKGGSDRASLHRCPRSCCRSRSSGA